MKITKHTIKLIVLFILSYIITQIMVKLITPSNFFTSPTYFLMPIVGFFGLYLLTPIIIKYLKIKKTSFLIIFIIIGIIGFYIALFFFYWNALKVLNNQPISFPFFKLFFDSAYLEFLVASIFGILASK